MPRTVQITIASHQTDDLLAQIQQIDEVVGLRVQRNISLQPPGDVVSVEVTNRALHHLHSLLAEQGIGQSSESSISTSEPLSVISSSFSEALTSDVNEATWEEMETEIAKESNTTINSLIVMLLAGVLATIGISTNSLHTVIGAMVIAPGFEPITRVALGMVSRSQSWKRGLADTAKAYVVLICGAILTTLVLRALGKDPLGGEASYLPEGVLVAYWSSLTIPSLIVTGAASIVGAILVATNRSVLTAGVMIALALVPTAALAGMSLATGEMDMFTRALARWSVEVAFIFLFSLGVLAWKRASVQRRGMME